MQWFCSFSRLRSLSRRQLAVPDIHPREDAVSPRTNDNIERESPFETDSKMPQ